MIGIDKMIGAIEVDNTERKIGKDVIGIGTETGMVMVSRNGVKERTFEITILDHMNLRKIESHISRLQDERSKIIFTLFPMRPTVFVGIEWLLY
jgi:hypothetical protein